MIRDAVRSSVVSLQQKIAAQQQTIKQLTGSAK
jgi:hypothetical protein